MGPPTAPRAYRKDLLLQKTRRQKQRLEATATKARELLQPELTTLRRDADAARSRAPLHCNATGHARLQIQTADVHNRNLKKKNLEARGDAEAARQDLKEAREQLRRTTERLGCWKAWWSCCNRGFNA
jgi:hypothetical protein